MINYPTDIIFRICNLRYRSQKKIIRNNITRMIEEPNQRGFDSRQGPNLYSLPCVPDYLNLRYPPYDQLLVIKRQLSIREYRKLKKERYADKGGWRLSPYAYLLNNTCPKCGQSLYATYQCSPPDTWVKRCGRAGVLVYCPNCPADLNFFLTVMN